MDENNNNQSPGSTDSPSITPTSTFSDTASSETTPDPASSAMPTSDAPAVTPSAPTSSDAPSVSPPTPPNVVSTPAPMKKPMKLPLRTVGMVLLAVLIPVAGLTGYATANKKTVTANSEVKDLTAKLDTATATTHELPADAVKITDCIPNMGFHYLPKTSDKVYGPWLLVNKQNRVIGVEYMADHSMYTKIPNTKPPVEILQKDSPLFGWTYDHTEFYRTPEGHEGDEVDHIDVHYYTVSKEVVAKSCE